MKEETKTKLKLSILFTSILGVLIFSGIFIYNYFDNSYEKMVRLVKEKKYEEAIKVADELIKDNNGTANIYKLKSSIIRGKDENSSMKVLIEGKNKLKERPAEYCLLNEEIFFKASNAQMDVMTLIDEIEYSMPKCEIFYSKESRAAFYPLIGFRALNNGEYDKFREYKQKNEDMINLDSIENEEVKEFNMKFREREI